MCALGVNKRTTGILLLFKADSTKKEDYLANWEEIWGGILLSRLEVQKK